MIRDGKFPPSFRFANGARIAWLREDIEAWIRRWAATPVIRNPNMKPPRGVRRPGEAAGNSPQNALQPASSPDRQVFAPVWSTPAAIVLEPPQARPRRLRQSTATAPLAAQVQPLPPKRFRQSTTKGGIQHRIHHN
jgi:hypothetical protein